MQCKKEAHSFSIKIIRNTIFNIIGHFWQLIVALILTPYIIGHIGIERYGIWAIVSVLTGYFGLLDFGIGTSFVKYISEFYANKNIKKLNQFVSTGIIFYLIFACVIIGLSFCCLIRPIVLLFKIPSHLYAEATFVFLMGLTLFGIANIMSPFRAIQIGLQRMDIINKVNIAISLPIIVGTVYFLEMGYGLRGLIINNAIILCINSIVSILVSFRILPALKCRLSLFRKEEFIKMLNFGVKLQLTKLADAVSFGIDKILISHFLGIGLVTFYQLGAMIVEKARSIPVLLISAVLPAASELDAANDMGRLNKLYYRSYKYTIALGMPLMVYILFKSNMIMLAWMGANFDKAVWTIRILAVGYFFNLLGGPAATVGAGIGRPDIQMKAAILMATLNFTLSLIFIIQFGFFGAVVATSFSLIVAHVFHLIIFHRIMQVKLILLWKNVLPVPVTACLLSTILIYGCDVLFRMFIANASRIVLLIVIIIEGLFFAGVYLLVTFKGKYIDEFDLEIIQRIPLLRSMIQKVK